MRIQAGKWKGRRLEVPETARPTSGRARAALFDLLGPERIANARVLDLFAGSGAVGLEAVSRGAAAAVLVDADASAVASTCARIGAAPGEVRVVVGRRPRPPWPPSLGGAERFDLIFADPPYGGATRAGALGWAPPPCSRREGFSSSRPTKARRCVPRPD